MAGNPNNSENPHQAHELRVQLLIQKGRAKNLVREVQGPVFTLGTDGTCDMVLGDRQFPDVHSYICVRDNVVSLRHLGQGPPVTVNGREMRWGELRDGDRIRTGSYEFGIGIARCVVKRSAHGLDRHDNNAFAGTLDELPIWWSSIASMPVNWGSLVTDKSFHEGRFGSQNSWGGISEL